MQVDGRRAMDVNRNRRLDFGQYLVCETQSWLLKVTFEDFDFAAFAES